MKFVNRERMVRWLLQVQREGKRIILGLPTSPGNTQGLKVESVTYDEFARRKPLTEHAKKEKEEVNEER